MTTRLPYTGREFLDSLDDGREVWISQVTRLKVLRALGLKLTVSAD